MELIKTLGLFLFAGILEICGGYMVLVWLKNGESIFIGLIGFALLALYGYIPTLHTTHFGRVYVIYGGVFIITAMFWGWFIDGINPDKYDIIGMSICILGVIIILTGRDLFR